MNSARGTEPRATGRGRFRKVKLSATVTARRRVFQWADEDRAHGMHQPEKLEALGWVRVAPHPRYPTSWLMVRTW